MHHSYIFPFEFVTNIFHSQIVPAADTKSNPQAMAQNHHIIIYYYISYYTYDYINIYYYITIIFHIKTFI